MYKRNIGIIAVVLFLVGGLGTFVFANPSNETNENKPGINNTDPNNENGGSTTTSPDTNVDNNLNNTNDIVNDNPVVEDNTTTNDTILDRIDSNNITSTGSSNSSSVNNNTNNRVDNNSPIINDSSNGSTSNKPSTGNNTSNNNSSTNKPSTKPGDNNGSSNNGSTDNKPVVPDKNKEIYDKAKDMLNKIENNLNEKDLSEIKNLVDQLPASKEKEELLDIINNYLNIIEAQKLVNTLKTMVESSTNKEDLDKARDYRKTNKIDEKVNAIIGSKKDNIEKDLIELAKTLDDITSPTINGIEKDLYYKNLKISINDENTYTIKLNNVVVDNLEKLNSLIKNDGKYNLEVIDKAYNKTDISFTIDNVDPVIELESNKEGINNIYKSPVTIKVSDDNLDKIMLNGTEIANNYQVNNVGNYTVEVTDKAGNVSKKTFEIKKTNISINLIKPENLSYDGGLKAYKVEVIDEDNNIVKGLEQEITIEYYMGTIKLDFIPREMGNYTVKVSFAGNGIYNAVPEMTEDFEITEGTPDINTNYKQPFIYDGSPKEIEIFIEEKDGNRIQLDVEYFQVINGKKKYLGYDAPSSVGTYYAQACYSEINYGSGCKKINFEIKTAGDAIVNLAQDLLNP